MTASTAHFALGMAVGSAVAVPLLWRQWQKRGRLSAALGRWLLWSYGLGLYAVVPGILLRCGLPGTFCRGAWMNVFLLHPLLDRTGAGGMYKGAALIGALFAAQYFLILLAIRRCPARKHPGSVPRSRE